MKHLKSFPVHWIPRIILTGIVVFLSYNLFAQNAPGNSSGGSGQSFAPITPPAIPAGVKVNYVRELEPLQPVQTDNDVNNISTQYGSCLMRTDYSDGIGKPVQSVMRRYAADKKDIVSINVYDAFGRNEVDFLPFVKTSNAAGFTRDCASELRATYNNLGYQDEMYLYTQNLFEPSPLNRSTETRAQGNSWVGGSNGITSGMSIVQNATTIRLWTIDYLPGSYPMTTGTQVYLLKKTVTDEDGKRSIEYYDVNNNLVLEEVSDSKVSMGIVLQTYYVYDDYNQLRFVIPPKAVEELSTHSWVMTPQIADKLCFRYEYDEHGRMILLKKPGIGETLYVYDKQDQLIFFQDAMQRSGGCWVFLKYDTKGRNIQKGTFCSNDNGGSPAYSQSQLQNLANTLPSLTDPFLYYELETDVPDYAYYHASFTNAKVYLTYYFDNYDFTVPIASSAGTFTFNNSFAPVAGGYDNNFSRKTNGLLTGVKVAVSDNSSDLITVSFYNARSELIQTQRQNLNNTLSTLTMGYDFKGHMVKSILQQGTNLVITKLYGYDSYGRVVSIQHKINGANTYKQIAKYFYDDLGRLANRQLGSIAYNVLYEYNIRNWITGINKNYCLNNTGNAYFGMEICYDKNYNTSYLNGRIAGIKWRNFGTGNELRTYGYSYDDVSRLSAADYYQTNGTATNAQWQKTQKDFTASNMTYDANGNLLSMKHMGLDPGKSIIVLDDLTYHYQPMSNFLQSIDESNLSQSANNASHDKLADFRDAGGTTDYSYDVNGNLTSDANRNISSVNNNWFIVNKPLVINYSGGEKIEYTYDAMGNVLRKKITQAAVNGSIGTPTQYDYMDEVVFKNGDPVLIFHDEGRVRLDKSFSKIEGYDYFLRDHINNVRSIITEDASNSFPAYDHNNNTFANTSGGGNGPTEEYDRDPVTYVATSELTNNEVENELFDNITNTRSNKPLSEDPTDQKSALLNAVSGNVVGPGLMLKVMAGDLIQLGAEGFFNSPASGGQTSMQSLVTSILGALSGAAAGVVDAANSAIQNGVNPGDLFNLLLQLQGGLIDTSCPQAFLNYVMFDEAMNLVPEISGAIQVTQAGSWSPMNVPQFAVPQNGYLYVFSSNKSATNVRIDNTYIFHWQGRLLEEFHYYPYGLCFDVNTANNVARSGVKYNSQFLEQDEFTDATGNPYGLDWYDFAARSYDPQTGRWLQGDPMMQYPSPFMAMGNNPTSITDPLGLEDGGPDDLTTGRKWSGGYFFGADGSIRRAFNEFNDAGEKFGSGFVVWDFKEFFTQDFSGATYKGGNGWGFENKWSIGWAPPLPDLFSENNIDNKGGTITIQRTWETKSSTISTFTTSNGKVKGYILEPPGPSTTKSGINKRIPAGTYEVVLHNGGKYQNVYKLYNDQVPQWRAILVHSGNTPDDTKGCLLPGRTISADFVGKSKNLLLDINNFISEYINNGGVQVIILDPKKP